MNHFFSLDLSSAEPRDADEAWCFVVQEQNLYIDFAQQPGDLGIPRLPAFLLRQHPNYRYIGVLHGQPCYVCDEGEHELADQRLHPTPLRQIIGQLDDDTFTMVARALQVMSWRHNHRFCSRCGSPTVPHERELAMICPACDYRQYPRITPCVIALISDGEYALLGRSARFPSGFYSCLAGFMEAGETAEQAVRREVMEETGIQVGDLRYARSQSWPFPHSLMLGFHGDYAGGDIVIDDDEIVDAGWYRHDQLPRTPPPGSIALTLIEQWRAPYR